MTLKITPSNLNSYIYCKDINDFSQIINICNGVKTPKTQELDFGVFYENIVYDIIRNKELATSPFLESQISMSNIIKKVAPLDTLLIQVKKKKLVDNILFSGVADIISPDNVIIDIKTTSKNNNKKKLFSKSVQHIIYSILFDLKVFYYIIFSKYTNNISVEKYFITDTDEKYLYEVIADFESFLNKFNLYDSYIKNNK